MRIRKKMDNRGMSLVEVIIAITILGLVAVPVLHSLTSAMVYNAKARNRQEMTLTAESIMETFKGYDLAELKARFSPGGAGIEGITVTNPATDFYYEYSSSPLPEPAVNDVYTFHIDNMEADNGQSCNVTITATPTNNAIETVMVPDDMETTRDAVFKGDRDFDRNALNGAFTDFCRDANKDRLKDYFNGLPSHDGDPVVIIGATKLGLRDGSKVEQLYDPSASVFYVKHYLKLHERELTFTITKNASNEYVVKPTMVYKYNLEGLPYYLEKTGAPPMSDEYDEVLGTPSPTPGHTTEFHGESKTLEKFPDDGSYLEFSVDLSSVCTAEGNIYKNPDTAELNRLFIYYYPQYNLDEGKDRIVVKNDAAISNFQCYILKQRAEDINDTNTKVRESHYKGNVRIENSADGFEVFHNFDYNIGEGSSTPGGTVSGTVAAVHSYTKKKELSPGVFVSELEYALKTDTVLSYQLELTVMQEGRLITSLESTMNEPIKGR